MLNIRYLLPVLLLASAILSLTLPGCKPREEELQTTGGLAFSADTVKFDTVFTTLRTVTKRLWVYNRHPKAVNVDLISLDNPATSPYTLLINGDLKQTASGVYIRGNDSLLILVRAQLKDNGQNGAAKALVVQENLNFRTNGQDQHVLLRSFGQNIYLHDGTAKPLELPCGTIWTKDRPHVLYGNLVVPPNCTLRIRPGTRIYAHAGAALIVRGTLLVNDPSDYQPGTKDTDTVKATNPNIVRFAGDRSGEAQYATAPGQWTGILFDATSHGNVIRYAQIQNAAYGALLFNPENLANQPDLLLQNSVIRYISGANANFAGAATQLASYKLLGITEGAGILSFSGKVTAENTLFSDCYEYALRGYGGGSYSLNYCTIANYPATSAVRKTASLTFTNLSPLDGQPRKSSGLTVSVQNSIVWGAADDELYLENYEEYKANVKVQNTLLKSQLYGAATDASGVPGLAKAGLNNLFTDPKFVRINAGTSSDYRLGPGSPALASKTAVPPPAPRDLLNLLRNQTTPDLGAYRATKP
ncbi:hypothetical protein GKZ68_19135 [Hymenobacter sp. BRD128]|uniref:hypothetical protein n=1 Tax=Hymenobacter sp. BRD128 TaxID=2675878 RepID=UPI001564FDA3|nr:hypothetical protein [Hymenobacter sp. BRD128]QKG58555.1 hypothetical protein GKZ68_19135 [Hymenobacter sp. BRD128]